MNRTNTLTDHVCKTTRDYGAGIYSCKLFSSLHAHSQLSQHNQLELIYYFTYFSTVVASKICVFLSCRTFVVNTFSTGLVGVENVLSTTKGLQERNTQMLDATTVEK